MRHSFISEVAYRLGVEAAIIESEICYLAENLGTREKGVAKISVPFDRFEKKFGYFKSNIFDCMNEISESLPIYCCTDPETWITDIEVDEQWLLSRKAVM